MRTAVMLLCVGAMGCSEAVIVRPPSTYHAGDVVPGEGVVKVRNNSQTMATVGGVLMGVGVTVVVVGLAVAATCHESSGDFGLGGCFDQGVAALGSMGGGGIVFIVGAILLGVGLSPRAFVERPAPIMVRF
jgi:hypothetical protein